MCQVLEQLDKNAIYEFWKVCLLYENEAWWGEINSSSLPAIPVSREFSHWTEEVGVKTLTLTFLRYSDPLADIH